MDRREREGEQGEVGYMRWETGRRWSCGGREYGTGPEKEKRAEDEPGMEVSLREGEKARKGGKGCCGEVEGCTKETG